MVVVAGKLALAQQCMENAEDLSGLLLLHATFGNNAGLEALSCKALTQGKHNVAFVCLHLLHRHDSCVKLLLDSDRFPEAAFFARTYQPSAVSASLKVCCRS